MSLGRTWGLYTGVLVLSLLPAGCESGSSGTALGTAGDAGTEPQAEDECELGTFARCQAAPGCRSASRPCRKGSPNTFATECVCQSVELVNVCPSTETVNRPNAFAFGDDAFYWTEYVFVQFEPFSRLFVSSPFGAPGRLLASLDAPEPQLEIDGDRIHVRDSTKHWVYSADGELLKTEDLEMHPTDGSPGAGGASGSAGAGGAAGAEAEPQEGPNGGAEPSTLLWTEEGLTLDGELITERVLAFSVTESGVYYVPDAARAYVYFAPFEAPHDADAVAWTSYGETFSAVAVQGGHLYAAIKNDSVAMWRIVYGDLSVLDR